MLVHDRFYAGGDDMITVDHSNKDYPYAYYDDQEGITSAKNPEFWYALGMLNSRYPVPAPYRPYHSFGWIKSPANGKFFEFIWHFEANRIVTYIE